MREKPIRNTKLHLPRSTPTHPEQMEHETRKVFAKYSADFLRQVSGSSGMPVKTSHFIYIYMYKYICMCVYIYRVVRSRGRS